MNLRQFDLNLLLVFDAVLAERSVSRAAQRLSLTQPAVSHALARLRAACGDPIVERRGQVMVPTPRAMALQPEVRALLVRAQRVLNLSSSFDPATSNRSFHIGCSDLAARTLLLPALAAVRAQAPNVRMHLVHAGRSDAADLIRTGALDIALGIFNGSDDTVQVHTARDDPYVCVMAEGHPLAKGPLSLKRYLAAPHLQVLVQPGTFGVVDQTLARLGHERRIGVVAAHFDVAAAMVRQSDLVLTAPRGLLTARPADGLTKRELPFAVEPYRHQLATKRQAAEDPGVAWLAALILDAAAAQPRPRTRARAASPA